jgi:hypothetical protein
VDEYQWDKKISFFASLSSCGMVIEVSISSLAVNDHGWQWLAMVLKTFDRLCSGTNWPENAQLQKDSNPSFDEASRLDEFMPVCRWVDC